MSCEQLAGELRELEHLLQQTSTEHKRQEILGRIDNVRAEQQKQGCLQEPQTSSNSGS